MILRECSVCFVERRKVKMAKQLTGLVVSNSMQNTIVVEIVRRTPHPLYRKLLKRSKKIKVHTDGQEVVLGTKVTIEETKPISKDKHFLLVTPAVKETAVVTEKKPVKKTKEEKK